MRINQFVAKATGLGRRKADKLILNGLITVNDKPANLGQDITDGDSVKYSNRIIELPYGYTRILLNKPVGYVCSRDGQGSKTIYDLIPKKYSKLKSIGRLDKDTSGLILLTNDGQLAQELSHPSFNKQKIYEVKLPRDLAKDQFDKLQNGSIRIDKRPSVLKLKKIGSALYEVTLTEGRNRQIRRSFEKINIKILKLNRLQFGPYKLSDLKGQTWLEIQ